jgi:hypothetical protein
MKIVPADEVIAELKKKAAEYEDKAKTVSGIAAQQGEKAK